MIKTRFAPSPTGSMHIGNVRTALFSALFAKKNNGKFLLRIEDTDFARSDEKYTKLLMQDLHWLGIFWDEGPETNDQASGPYFQSKRNIIYEKYFKQLEDLGLAYPCFCSDEKLKLHNKVMLASGKPPRYSGLCRNLLKSEIAAKIANGEKPTLRFKVPLKQTIEFVDLVKGKQTFVSDDIGDFIIKKTDDSSSFMFCNAIDDSLMQVTHVIRGEDHLTNTPRQLMILNALALQTPEYGHISLITGFDGAPLSKRHGSSSIDDLRIQGILPGAILNYLARLGCHYDNNNFLTLAELAQNFEVTSLAKSSAKFDQDQLKHWQRLALEKINTNEFWQWAGSNIKDIIPHEKQEEFILTIRNNVLTPNDLFLWAHVLFSELKYTPENIIILQNAGEKFFNAIINAVAQFGTDYKQVIEYLKTNLQIKNKELFLPLRIILTGQEHGPELLHIFALLGKDKLLNRIKNSLMII